MDAIDLILSVTTPAELFKTDDAEAYLKKLQRAVHPDLNPTRVEDATLAFVKLNQFYKRFTTKTFATVTTKRGSWTVLADVWKSSGVRYRAVEDTDETWVAYVATPGASGSFVEGHRILEDLVRTLEEKDAAEGTSHRNFFPLTLDKFKLGEHKREARVLSSGVVGTRWFPLSQWTSVDPKDIAWIARRGLVALDLIHNAGYLHGSPHLEAFIIEPEQHGLMLKDWQYSVRRGDPLRLIDPQAKDAYPAWAKDTDATKNTAMDLMVFGHAFAKLAKSSNAPAWLERFFHKLQTDPPKKAVHGLRKLDELLDAHWERKFHPMAYPVK